MKDTSKLDAAGVARACARVLKAANWPLYKSINKWKALPGIHCHRVGYGSLVRVTWLGGEGFYHSPGRHFEEQQRERWAWEVLRSKGYPVDEQGAIQCKESKA